MALITCPECDSKISTSAKSCPHCGHPINESLPSQAFNLNDWLNMPKIYYFINWSCGIFFLFAGIIGATLDLVPGLLLCLAGILWLPPSFALISKRTGLQFSGGIKRTTIIALFIGFVISIPEKEKPLEEPEVIASKEAVIPKKTPKDIALEAAKKEQAELDAALEKAAANEACKKDIQCYGEKNSELTWRCKKLIERLAKHSFEWTDSWIETKFPHFKWLNKEEFTVTYMGDKIKYQNGFGAWGNITYECDIDTINKAVLDIRVREGYL